MKIQQKDFLIVLSNTNKAQLVRCTLAEDDSYRGTLEAKRALGEKDALTDFVLSDVVANLGRRPRLGTVHGVKIEPLVARLSSPSKMWTEIRLHQFLTPEQKEELQKTLAETTSKLKTLGLGILRCELEIRQPSGKYAGFYKFRAKAETDILCIKPEENLENFQYMLCHEAAHGMWNRMLTAKTRIKWIQLYHEYIQLQEVAEGELQSILEGIVAATSVRDYLKEDENVENIPIVKDALRHIQRVHGLGKHHLELALNGGEDISAYWPTALELSTKEEAVSEYSTKSPEEFFAETFSFHACGRKLPKKVQSLLDTTMSRLKKA